MADPASARLARFGARGARLVDVLRVDGPHALLTTLGDGVRWRRQLQEFTEWECIVVDDPSLDDAVQVAQRFAAVDPRFTVLVHDRVRGLSAARNTGLAAARAPLVCFLDDDDLLLAGSLRTRYDALVEQPLDVIGAYCDWIGIEPGDRLERRRPHRMPRSLDGVVFGVLVSRFSTVPFEAIARGIPFVYHNPHGERVPTFTDPAGAFLVSRSSNELAVAFTTALSWRDWYRDRAEKFFRRQVDVDDDRPSEVRAADVIVEEIAQSR
jgi:glycosyltransferase involved in cell wall biosynthesis